MSADLGDAREKRPVLTVGRCVDLEFVRLIGLNHQVIDRERPAQVDLQRGRLRRRARRARRADRARVRLAGRQDVREITVVVVGAVRRELAVDDHRLGAVSGRAERGRVAGGILELHFGDRERVAAGDGEDADIARLERLGGAAGGRDDASRPEPAAGHARELPQLDPAHAVARVVELIDVVVVRLNDRAARARGLAPVAAQALHFTEIDRQSRRGSRQMSQHDGVLRVGRAMSFRGEHAVGDLIRTRADRMLADGDQIAAGVP